MTSRQEARAIPRVDERRLDTHVGAASIRRQGDLARHRAEDDLTDDRRRGGVHQDDAAARTEPEWTGAHDEDPDVGSSAVRGDGDRGCRGREAGVGCGFGGERRDDGAGGDVDDVDQTGRHVGASTVRRDGDVTAASHGDGSHDGPERRVDDVDRSPS